LPENIHEVNDYCQYLFFLLFIMTLSLFITSESPIFSAATAKNNKKALNCVFAILQIVCFHVSSPGFSAIYRFSTNNTCVMLVCSYNSLAHSKELFQKLSLDCGHEKSKALSLC